MSNNNVSDKKIEFAMRKQRALLTAPLSGYVSAEARAIIDRLIGMGFDPDLAFSFVESGLTEEEFYDLPPLNATETDDG